MIAASLSTADMARISADVARAAAQEGVIALDELATLLDDTLDLMRERAGHRSDPSNLVHVITGRLIASFRIAGPVAIKRGTLEGAIVPGVSYAIDEINRGGTHDYASRTVLATTALRKQAAERMARGIAALIEGRAP